jgi:hypothetical protein
MFELDQAIAEWRRQMAADGLKAPALLDELESHLRDDVERQLQSGAGMEPAFRAAVSRLGPAGALTNEFSKIGEMNAVFARVKFFLLTLAGIQNPILATNMNSPYPNTHFEPRWATYLKSAAFLLPAITLWLAMTVFVVPKIREMCYQAKVTLPAVYDLVFSLMQHGVLIGGALVAALVFLEWRSDRWPRYRRAAFGIGVFALNSAVLTLISFLVIYAVIAATHISQPSAHQILFP